MGAGRGVGGVGGEGGVRRVCETGVAVVGGTGRTPLAGVRVRVARVDVRLRVRTRVFLGVVGHVTGPTAARRIPANLL